MEREDPSDNFWKSLVQALPAKNSNRSHDPSSLVNNTMSVNSPIHEYEKIRRLFIYGVTALVYYKLILPDVMELHKTALDLDSLATSILKSQGEMIPPTPPVKTPTLYNQECLDFNGNFM